MGTSALYSTATQLESLKAFLSQTSVGRLKFRSYNPLNITSCKTPPFFFCVLLRSTEQGHKSKPLHKNAFADQKLATWS